MMNNRLNACFERLRAAQRKALVGYLTAGDPDFDASLAILSAACDAGLDVLELGIPFSDPTADGPVIQAAAARALAAGMHLSRALALTRELRARHETPIVLFSYYNPLLQYGARRLFDDALAAGADGLLVVDLPPEESGELTDAWPSPARLPLIRLVAPTTPPERMRRIVRDAGGFLYMITRVGVTGEGGLNPGDVAVQARRLRDVTALPICLGFGVRDAHDVAALAPLADGVVVGSALVRKAAEDGDAAARAARVADLVRELRVGLTPA